MEPATSTLSYVRESDLVEALRTHVPAEVRPMKETLARLDDLHAAYRLLLGREPDPEGYASFAAAVGAGTLTVDGLAQAILGSPEFVQRNNDVPLEVELEGYSIFVRARDRDIG